MIAFLCGFICGAGVLAFVALRLGGSKPQAETPFVAPLGASGHGVSMDAFAARQIRAAIEKYEGIA